MKAFYEFFAGGGMARAGLGTDWKCLFANDIDAKKASTYADNWGAQDLLVGDVAKISSVQLPAKADLVWASFPCQDLSLAGDYIGLDGSRSGTFWPFWRLMKKLISENRAPRAFVIENVYGAITSNDGKDFHSIGSALSDAGYKFGATVLDARYWVPQSRPRLFFIAFNSDCYIPEKFYSGPASIFHPQTLIDAVDGMESSSKRDWLWWNIPMPSPRKLNFIDVIESDTKNLKWHTADETNYIISLMSERNLAKLKNATKTSKVTNTSMVGGVYRRTRDGQQRAEIRFDDISGCLRTPSGGSSRQTIMLIDNGKIRSRLLSSREAARLMGLPDTYRLPARYNDAYHVCGDGVVVPVVRHLAKNLIEPVLSCNDQEQIMAAE